MSLLRALSHQKQEIGGVGQLLVMHVNHQLRGAESDEDTEWLTRQCEQFQMPLEVLTADTAAYADELGHGIEAAARRLRYELLTRCAEQHGARYLATAHTRDDQVETVLFRTLRGTGLRGLAGIPPTRNLSAALTVIRPLLNCSREMVTDYLDAIGQPHRTDSSNDDPQFARNRIRHELLPLLRERYNSDLDAALLRLALQADEAQSTLEFLAEQQLSKAALVVAEHELSFDRFAFGQQQHVIAAEAIRIAWRRAKLGEQAMSYEAWSAMAALLQSDSRPSALNLPGNVHASIEGKRFVLRW